MNRVEWKTHLGKKILYINYSNLNASHEDEKKVILETIKQAWAEAAASTEKVRFLSDITGTSANSEVMKELKQFALYTASNNKTEKECVVGMSSIQKVLVGGVNLFAKSKLQMFDGIDEALDWLVK